MAKKIYFSLHFDFFSISVKTFAVLLALELLALSSINLLIVQSSNNPKAFIQPENNSINPLRTDNYSVRILRTADEKSLFANSNVKDIQSIAEFKKKVLCKDEENVVNLIYSSSTQKNTCNNNLRMVMFYANWCSACHRYSSTWIKQSNYFGNKGNIIYFAFDCHKNLMHQHLCLEARISSYPTLLVFCSIEKSFSVNSVYEYSTKFNVKSPNYFSFVIPYDFYSYDKSIQWIESEFKVETLLGNKLHNTEKLNIDDLAAIARKTNSFHRWNEMSNGVFSSRSFLEYLSSNLSELRIFRSFNNPHSKFSNLNSSSSNFLLSKNTPDLYLHDGLLGFIYILRNCLILKAVKEEDFVEGEKVNKEKENNSSRMVLYLNSEYASSLCRILDSVYRVLFAKNMKEEIKSIYEFLNCEKSKSDATSSSFRININSLNSFMDTWSIGNIKSFKQGVFPPYKNCKTVLCGVWLFFHFLFISLNVQANQISRKTNLAELGSKETNNDGVQLSPDMQELDILTPYELLSILKETVFNFFGCSECYLHFYQMYSTCAYDKCDLIPDINAYSSITQGYKLSVDVSMMQILHYDGDKPHKNYSNTIKITQNKTTIQFLNRYEALVFWLWKVHNVVTLRTAADETVEFFKILSKLINEKISLDEHNKKAKYVHDENVFINVNGNSKNHASISDKDLKNIVDRLKHTYYKNYFDMDVRWPSKQSCPKCRFSDVKPVLINEEILKKVLRRNEINNFSNDISENEKNEVQDIRMWNLMGDYDWNYTYKFLKKAYFKDEWVDFENKNLVFSKNTETFHIKE